MREAQARCDSREFAEWIAFWSIEPWGEQLADLRCGIIGSLIANIHAKEGKKFTVEDFMPVYGESKAEPQSPEQMQAIFKALAKQGQRKPFPAPERQPKGS